jgi:hypothetical protein
LLTWSAWHTAFGHEVACHPERVLKARDNKAVSKRRANALGGLAKLIPAQTLRAAAIGITCLSCDDVTTRAARKALRPKPTAAIQRRKQRQICSRPRAAQSALLKNADDAAGTARGKRR